MLIGGVSNYFENVEFLDSKRVKTTAAIEEDEHGVKTYHFSAIDYGVTGNDIFIKNIGYEGDKVIIYYQQNKPHIVHREKNPKWIWLNSLIPLGWSIFLGGLVFFRSKRFTIK